MGNIGSSDIGRRQKAPDTETLQGNGRARSPTFDVVAFLWTLSKEALAGWVAPSLEAIALNRGSNSFELVLGRNTHWTSLKAPSTDHHVVRTVVDSRSRRARSELGPCDKLLPPDEASSPRLDTCQRLAMQHIEPGSCLTIAPPAAIRLVADYSPLKGCDSTCSGVGDTCACFDAET
jgi:hypothetical protein